MEEKYRYAIMGYEKDGDVYENIGGYDPDYSLAVQKARALAVAMRKGFLIRQSINYGLPEYEPFDWIEVWDTENEDECVFMEN